MKPGYFFSSARLILCVLLVACFLPSAAWAKGPTLIRDTEIEETLKGWVAPIARAAGISPDSVNIILVQDPQLNAFVAGGPNIFIYTGLLLETDNPGEIIGVMAHEMGHISGGHLVRLHDAVNRATYESLVGTVLGIGAAILTGQGEAAAAVTAGTQSTALRRLLAHTRVQESSADQAALKFLEQAKIDPDGLASFMKKLENQELLPEGQQSEYIRTHPLTRDRVAALEAGVQRSSVKDKGYNPAWVDQHARMKAKLVGFIEPDTVDWAYPDSDGSIAALYARAIARHRMQDTRGALALIGQLLEREPDNAYFQELKGQVLFESGRVAESVEPYRRAAEKMPNAPLILTAYGHALLESGGDDPVRLKEAIAALEKSLRREENASRPHRLLAMAYGRLGREDMARLHLADEALLTDELDDARRHAEAALSAFPQGSRERLHAQDLLIDIEQRERKKEGEEER